MLNIAIINSPYYMLHVMQLYIYLRSTQLVGQKEELGELEKHMSVQVKARNMLQTRLEISEEISGIYNRVYGK